MANEKEPWFVLERSEALAGLLLTSRNDVKVRSEKKTDKGVDLLMEIQSDEAPSLRLFVVQVRGTLSSDRNEWLTSVHELFRHGTGAFLMPACVFVVDVRQNHVYYAWLAEPLIEGEKARLRFASKGVFHDLDMQAVDEIVRRVNAWYDVLPKQLVSTS